MALMLIHRHQITLQINRIAHENLGDDLITRIGALWGGGANLLVRAPGAGIGPPRLLRLRSRAI